MGDEYMVLKGAHGYHFVAMKFVLSLIGVAVGTTNMFAPDMKRKQPRYQRAAVAIIKPVVF